jgi:hypothetical protein
VLRLNAGNTVGNFEKEAFVSRTHASARVPIPRVISFGRPGELRYCIAGAYGWVIDRMEPCL